MAYTKGIFVLAALCLIAMASAFVPQHAARAPALFPASLTKVAPCPPASTITTPVPQPASRSSPLAPTVTAAIPLHTAQSFPPFPSSTGSVPRHAAGSFPPLATFTPSASRHGARSYPPLPSLTTPTSQPAAASVCCECGSSPCMCGFAASATESSSVL